ncbi:MAG: SLBB domain-containing protein [Clostridiales bacterium]|nr:SLBB domain-containing protein [Clostridiales bacterium]MCD8127274.1 SLBB domain-containing protein [Clostridiales bacterium]
MEQTKILTLLTEEFEKTNSLSRAQLEALAEANDIPFAQLAGTASFYSLFNKGPMGQVSSCKVPETALPGETREILSQPRDYAGLKAALAAPDAILGEVTASGLRGRGGAGFPVGLKWKTTLDCNAPVKYVVVNADEGEPDTAKDGAILRAVPHAVLEGMAICALCVGASQGYVYIRAEYPEEKAILEQELARARAEGFLGEHICGTDFSFDVEVVAGAGSYVCGEETALLSSLEGQRGEPRLKPPFPGVAGLFQMPTVLNNTETMANVPLVFREGAAAYRRFGTEKNPGTKVFTVCGEVERPGVYEFPLGTSLRTVLEAVGYDPANVKAIQVGGGASGGLIGPDKLDATLDIEGIAAAGGALGTGSVRVLGKDADMVTLCRNVAEFFVDESCGKCTPCRFGTKRMADLLAAMAEGRAEPGSVKELRSLSAYLTDNARCALGQAASTVLLSALALFPEEFEEPCVGGEL